MKIAFVYPHSGFSEPVVKLSDAIAIVTFELARRLARDHEVIVYCRRDKGEPAESRHGNLVFRRFDQTFDFALFRLRLLETVGLLRPTHPFRFTSLYYRVFIERVARDIAREAVDVVHVHNVSSFIPVIRKHAPASALVLHSHDHALADFDPDVALERLRMADLILGCSAHLAGNLRERFPELEERIEPFVNGVDRRFLEVESDPKRSAEVVFVGRLSPEKGVHVLVEAFGRISAEHPDASLSLIGPNHVPNKHFVDPFGDDEVLAGTEAYYRKGSSSYLDDLLKAGEGLQVMMPGPIDNRDLPARLARAGIFVFASLWQEPFGIPAVEAMAAGLPVIATRAGALPEIVEDGVTGILVDRGDVDGLAGALRTLLDDPERRAAMGRAGRKRVEELFDWDVLAERLASHYEAIVAPGQTGRQRRTASADPVPCRRSA